MITVVHIDGLSGINYHRLIVPLRRLQAQGVNLHWIESLNELKDMNLDLVDNLIVSRKTSVTNHQKFSQLLKKHGVSLILDNDDYWVLNPENPAKPLYETYYGPDIKKTIKIADVIWTPSRYLGKLMARENPNAVIEFVNNGIDTQEDQWIKQRKKPNKELRFGYLGAAAHIKDVQTIGYDFSKVYTFGVEGMGYDSIFQYSKSSFARDIWNYGQLYRDVDVSLVPLAVNRFNWCKSDLKITEAAHTKTAVIATNTRPYSTSIIHGETGLLVSSREEWKEAIESMDKKLAKKLGANLYEALKDCPDHNLDLVNEKRLKYLV
jgi:glycosyltransferase involved in cell wall biosynthesis